MNKELKTYETQKGMATVEIRRKFNALRGDHLWIKFSKAAERDQARYITSINITIDNKRSDSIGHKLILFKKHDSACLKIPLKKDREYEIWMNTQVFNSKQKKSDKLEIPATTRFSTKGKNIRPGAKTKREVVYIPTKVAP